jgi:peptidyl-tRNA hydrolase, PTH1 family
MNRSGGPMVAAMRAFEVHPAQILIITDDFHLDLGAIRARGTGSTGGHNGLASIEEVLGSTDYARLRIGVGTPGADTVDFVLDRFGPDEESVMEETVMIASWAAEDWANGLSIDELQAKYNRRKPQA